MSAWVDDKSHKIPARLSSAVEQPISSEIKMADGLFIKSMAVEKAGTVIPQHSHRYDHVSALTLGAVRVWENGLLSGEYEPPALLTIKAGVKHTFLTLRDATLILCIHNISRADVIEIEDEHQLDGEYV